MFKIICFLFVIYSVTPCLCRQIKTSTMPINGNDELIVTSNNYRNEKNESSITYIRATIPMKIFRCMKQFNILRCMKIFMLQRMERAKPHSGNLTADFLDQILSSERDDKNDFEQQYVSMEDQMLDSKLLKSIQTFFQDREIKLHFIPGMIIKVKPSLEDKIDVSLKREEGSLVDQSGRTRKKKPYEYIVNVGLPALMMPMILMGTVLPMVLPAVKMATLLSGAINSGALLAAVMYLAKTATNQSAEKSTVYYNGGGFH